MRLSHPVVSSRVRRSTLLVCCVATMSADGKCGAQTHVGCLVAGLRQALRDVCSCRADATSRVSRAPRGSVVQGPCF